MRNADELAALPQVALLFLGAWAGSAVALGTIVLLLSGKPSLRYLMAGLTAVAALILVFDGVSSAFQNVRGVGLQVCIDVAITVLVLWAAARVNATNLVRVTSVMAPLLLAYNVVAYLDARPAVVNADEPVSGTVNARIAVPTRGNIYHILLDGFQSEAFDFLVRQHPDLLPPELTYYPDFRTHFLHTHYSIPSTVTGTIYEPETSIGDWKRRFVESEGIWGRLHQAGWRLRMYPYYPIPNMAGDTVVWSALALGTNPRMDLVDLWVLNLLPRSLAMRAKRRDTVPEANAGALDLSSVTFSFTRAIGLRPETLPSETFAYRSVLNFERLLSEMADLPSTGQYVFAHLIIPHHPYVLDGECAYVGEEPGFSTGGYLGQCQCALRMVGRLMLQLRELGALNEALVIVHADHGANLGLGPQLLKVISGDGDGDGAVSFDPIEWKATPPSTWSRVTTAEVRQRSLALLLATGPGLTRNARAAMPMQMQDIAPTVLEHAGLPHEDLGGWAMQHGPPPTDRLLRVLASYHFGRDIPFGGEFYEYRDENGVLEFHGTVPVAP